MLDDPQPELNNNSFPKIALVLALAVGVILVVILIFFIINFFRPQSATNTNIPTPTPVRTVDSLPQDQRVSTLQKSVINKTTQDEIESAQEYESKTTQPDGSTVYYFKSPYDARKAEVIVRNNVVVFERIMTPVSSKDPGYARI